MFSSPARFLGIIAAFCALGTALGSGVGPTDPPVDSPVSRTRPPAASWAWPLDAPRQVIRPFEAPATRYSAGHRGVDIAAAGGTAVLAPADGVVSFTGIVVDRPLLSITHPGGLVSSVEPVVASVDEGAAVQTGDVVGVVAEGGHCSGRCAHFGVRLYGEYVNPLALTGSLPRAVLLPLER